MVSLCMELLTDMRRLPIVNKKVQSKLDLSKHLVETQNTTVQN